MSDPIVDEVRRYRMEHTRKCDSNLARICQDIREIQIPVRAQGGASSPQEAPAGS